MTLGTDEERRLREAARDWLALLASGEASAEALARFRDWQANSPDHARIFEEERTTLQQISREAARLYPQPVARRRISRRAVLGGGLVAASGAGVALVLPGQLTRLRADILTGVDERLSLDLPDGSQLQLNTRTALALGTDEGARGLHLLEGEIFLQVRSGNQPFRLTAGGGEARLTGGAVALRRVSHRAALVVAEGQAELAAQSGPAVQVPASQGAEWIEGQPPDGPHPVDLARRLAWRQGEVIFEATPFSEAADELARYLPQRVLVRPGVGPLGRVSGRFRTADARPALAALARTQGLRMRDIAGLALVIT